jgi:Peptidase of plants and bacteria
MPPATPPYFQIPMTPVPAAVTKKKHVKPDRTPLLRLEIRDLADEGARTFLSHLNVGTVLEEAVAGVLDLLYTSNSKLPTSRSVTLILRSMPGVAYTTGKDIDDDHKEIHFSTDYIANIPKERKRHEMLGVIRHEMVHCWQWNAQGTCPGGLIEGIADWVRLRSNLSPPHWKQEWDGDWDAGYQHTGYFLDYLESRFGDGTVVAINERLRDKKYKEEEFWTAVCGHDVKTLWKQYGKHMEELHGKNDKEGQERADDARQEENLRKIMEGQGEVLP